MSDDNDDDEVLRRANELERDEFFRRVANREYERLQSARYGLILHVLNIGLWITVMLVSCSCGTSSSPLLKPNALAESVLLAPGDVLDALAADVYAHEAIRHPKSACDVIGGAPITVPPRSRPLAGRELRVLWQTRPTTPPALPGAQTALLVATEPTPWAELPGAPGCWLQVTPRWVLTPRPGSVLTQLAGQVELRWTPPASLVGTTFFMQLAVQDPRNDAGVTLTPLLEMTVGSK